MTEPTTCTVPVEFLRGVIALCSQRGFSPENIEAWDKSDKWVADLWRKAEAALATPQPTQAQAGAVPLTDEQIEALPLWKRFVGLWPETRREIVRTIERHHGIKGGQHGTS